MTNADRRRGGKTRAAQFTHEYQRNAGKALAEKRGPDYFREIGRKGAATTHKKYKFKPAGTRGWVMVGRKTGEIIATMDVSL